MFDRPRVGPQESESALANVQVTSVSAPGIESFVESLTNNQSRLYAFIFSQLGDADVAGDVLQETNLVLWRKAAEFDSRRDFMAWAFAFAKNQVRAARQRGGRSRLLFSDEAVARLADRAVPRAAQTDVRLVALAGCLETLSDTDRDLVRARYDRGHTMSETADASGRTASAVAVAIFRIRQSLARCIQNRLAAEGSS